jgi:hypothetical protein
MFSQNHQGGTLPPDGARNIVMERPHFYLYVFRLFLVMNIINIIIKLR